MLTAELWRGVGEVGIVVEGYRLTSTPVVFGSESTYLLGSLMWRR